MRSILDFFRKKEPEQVNQKPWTHWMIDNQKYAIKDSFDIKCQTIPDGKQIYGWTLETRYKINGEWCQWYTYYNNRIYQSMSSAIGAGIKTHPNGKENVDWRICPLYKMENAEFREFKIDQLLNKTKENEKYEIKAWILEEDFERKFNNNFMIHKKGSVFIQKDNGGIIISATPKTIALHGYNYLFKEIQKYGRIKEINLIDEKQLHPHLLKSIKQKLNIK